MSSRQDFKMDFGDLENALKELGAPVATKAGAEGLRKATNVMRDAVKKKAPEGEQSTRRTWRNKDGSQSSADYGRLRQNIKTRKQRTRKSHTISYVVTTGKAFWGRFSEFGTEHEPADPWFKPAVDQVAGQVVAALQDELKRAIEKAARKANR